MVTTRNVEYRHGSATLEGVLVSSAELPAGAPTVLVCHGAEGRSDAQVEIAGRLVEWGYQGFAVDLFGRGVSASAPAEYVALMRPFLEDRAMLADRLSTVVATVAGLPEVDPTRVAAIGFCFGGLCVLDMARTGLGVTGVASFHGVLTAPPAWFPSLIGCKVAVYHGWDDPYAPPQDVIALASEMTASRADWQLHAFGHALHAFMAPWADSPELGIRYHPQVAARAWSSLEDFLSECL